MTAHLPRTPDGLAAYYNIVNHSRGIKLPPHLVPVCFALMDNRIPNLEVIVGPGGGKSMLLSVIYPTFEIGQDPTMTVLGISAGESLVQGFMKASMDLIDSSPEWKQIFPDVAPDKMKGWSTERGMFVTGHSPGDPDSNYFVGGLTSSSITGKHARTVIGDDLHNKESSTSADACRRVRSDYYKTFLGRADPRGARFILAGRRWHQEDVYGHIAEMGTHVVMVLPAERKQTTELWWDVSLPDGLTCCFNDGSMPDSVQVGDVRTI